MSSTPNPSCPPFVEAATTIRVAPGDLGHEPAQRVAHVAAALDPRVDGHAVVERPLLDGVEDRHGRAARAAAGESSGEVERDRREAAGTSVACSARRAAGRRRARGSDRFESDEREEDRAG